MMIVNKDSLSLAKRFGPKKLCLREGMSTPWCPSGCSLEGGWAEFWR